MDAVGPIFYVAEITARLVTVTFTPPVYGIGVRPLGTLSPMSSTLSRTTSVFVSDVGYRGTPSGGSLQVYPARLDQAFTLDRHMTLPPSGGVTAISAGSMTLINVGGTYDSVAGTLSTDGQPVRVLAGRRVMPAADPRLMFLDPAYSTLSPAFVGMGQPWQLSEQTLEVPLQDATYWLQGPIQTSVYLGTGGLRGTPDLTGKTLPMLRGGTSSNPVRNMTPETVDPAYLIYQVSDGPGVVTNIYEGGYGPNDGTHGYVNAGQVSDIYSASVPSGKWVWSSSASGLFIRLGSSPTYQITCDACGYFQDGGQAFTPLALALAIIRYQTLLDPSFIDFGTWSAADAAYSYTAGIFVAGGGTDTAISVVSTLLGSIGAKLIANRAGLLRPFVLRAPVAGATPRGHFTTANVSTLTAQALDASLDPPPYRWRVGYQRLYTVQTTSLSPQIVNLSTKIYLAAQDRYAVWTGGGIFNAVSRPTDPDPVAGALLNQADAQSVANDLGTLWGVKRRSYAVTVPIEVGIGFDLGDNIMLSWPTGPLTPSAVGQIVGEQFRGGDATTTFTVLV